MEKKTSFVSEVSAMKDSLSSSLSRMSGSSRQKRRSKKLRRQTATIDVSYATDFYPESSSRLSELSEPEISERMKEFEDDLSETVSGATQSGSVETMDRLSILSDSVPELLDADRLSEMSIPEILISGSTSVPNLTLDSVKDSNADKDADGWRVIPITIVPSTEIVIQRNVDIISPQTPKESELSSPINNSVICEKRKSISPIIEKPESMEIVEGCEEKSEFQITSDSTSSTTTTTATEVDETAIDVVEQSAISASVPVTPRSEEKKRNKNKNKHSSPATSLLEKSASWLASLSGSKNNNNSNNKNVNNKSGNKEKKPFKMSTQRTKKSLTSLFEAVASSASSNNNNNNQKHSKISLSNTLPSDLFSKHGRTASSPEKLGLVKTESDLMFLMPSNVSASSLSLTDLSEPSESNSSLIRKIKEGNHLQLNPSPHPDGYYTIDSRHLTSSHHSRKSLADKKLLLGVKQFNLDPKKGLEFLDKAGFLDSTNPEEVASFLYREGRLSKKQIGAFIGDHHDLNKEVLKAFVDKHEFMNLILVQALRQFLWSFRLPGEAMQIDRIMESFALHYCDQNPNLFDETDTCYILSFSIIMLNTALHNPNVRQKITLEQFVAQNRGINSGKDLPKDILELIYRNIKDEPFKIPNESYDDLMYTFFSPEKEGWLLKQGGNWKSWKRRWFVLSDRCLYYFEHTTENIPKGIIPLENVKIRVVDEKDSRNYSFEVYSDSNNLVKGCKTDSRGTVVQGHHKTYRMCASSAEERDLWLDVIRDCIKEHPFYDIITAKKAALRRKSLRHVQQHDIPSTPSTPRQTTLQHSTTEPTPISYSVQT